MKKYIYLFIRDDNILFMNQWHSRWRSRSRGRSCAYGLFINFLMIKRFLFVGLLCSRMYEFYNQSQPRCDPNFSYHTRNIVTRGKQLIRQTILRIHLGDSVLTNASFLLYFWLTDVLDNTTVKHFMFSFIKFWLFKIFFLHFLSISDYVIYWSLYTCKLGMYYVVV
jgi:hypothetical protein